VSVFQDFSHQNCSWYSVVEQPTSVDTNQSTGPNRGGMASVICLLCLHLRETSTYLLTRFAQRRDARRLGCHLATLSGSNTSFLVLILFPSSCFFWRCTREKNKYRLSHFRESTNYTLVSSGFGTRSYSVWPSQRTGVRQCFYHSVYSVRQK
jgi:hypothetical protein